MILNLDAILIDYPLTLTFQIYSSNIDNEGEEPVYLDVAVDITK